MLYLVSEYAPNGEIFGNNYLPIIILIRRPSASESGLCGNDFSSLGTGTGMVNSNPKVQKREGNEKNPFPHFGNRNQMISFPGRDGNGNSRSPLFRIFTLNILIFNSSLIILTQHTSMNMNRKKLQMTHSNVQCKKYEQG